MSWREYWDRFVRVRACGGCGELLCYEQRSNAFCEGCYLKWSAAKVESCPHCLLPAVDCSCMPKELSKAGALCLRKLVLYRADRKGMPQNKVIYRLKHEPNTRIESFLARELSRGIREELAVLGAASCVLVPVPRRRASKNLYGFDQAERLCLAISRELGIPVSLALRRGWGDREQKGLSREKRFRNVSRSFALRRGESVRGKHVLLVDDVVTTGSGMTACVKLLRQAEAATVRCLCVGQTP